MLLDCAAILQRNALQHWVTGVSQKKKTNKTNKKFTWLVPIHLNVTTPQIVYQNNRAGLCLITFHILTTKFTKGFTQLVSHGSCLLLILQKLPGHSSQGADTSGVSTQEYCIHHRNKSPSSHIQSFKSYLQHLAT